MADTGYLSADSGASVTGAGTSPQAWSPTTGLTLKTSSTAVVSGFTNYFHFTDFDADAVIPADAIIDGIEVEVQTESGGDPIATGSLRLVVGGARTGNTKAVPTTSTVGSPAILGGSSDLWGLSLTAAQVRASDFGVAFWYFWFGLQAAPEDLFLDECRIKIYYHSGTVEANVTSSMVVLEGFVSSDVASSMVVQRDTQADVLSSMVVGLGLAITSPAQGETLTSSGTRISWELFPGVQADYRIRIYRDSAYTDLVYDSGIIGSSSLFHDVAPGLLPTGESLWIRLNVTTTTFTTAEAAAINVFTDFATSSNIEDVTAILIGGCNDPTALPGVLIEWTQVVPDPGEAFVSYDVYRREAGEDAYFRKASIAAIATVRYVDYEVKPGVTYEYAVVWQAVLGLSDLQSEFPAASVNVHVTFDFSFLHDPVDGLFIRLDTWTPSFDPIQDVRFVQPWGRPLPTVHYGEAFGYTITIENFAKMLKTQTDWDTLITLMQRKRRLCLRVGKSQQKFFVAVTRAPRRDSVLQWSTRLEFREVHYSEVV